MTVITLLVLTGLFESLPEATLAAIVIAALIELVDVPALRNLYRLAGRRPGQIYGLAARADFIAALTRRMRPSRSMRRRVLGDRRLLDLVARCKLRLRQAAARRD
jgi:Sulfate permease family